jgi:hypothetical protein
MTLLPSYTIMIEGRAIDCLLFLTSRQHGSTITLERVEKIVMGLSQSTPRDKNDTRSFEVPNLFFLRLHQAGELPDGIIKTREFFFLRF